MAGECLLHSRPGGGRRLGLIRLGRGWPLGWLILLFLVPGRLQLPVDEISPHSPLIKSMGHLDLKNGLKVHVEINIQIDDDIPRIPEELEEETTAAPILLMPAKTTTTTHKITKTTTKSVKTTTQTTSATSTHISCFDDPFGEGKCPENSGCFLDELGIYGEVGNHGFCHCFLGFYFDNSTSTCVDMRGGGNCEGNQPNICYQDIKNNAQFCPYCSAKKINENWPMGNYVSGEGSFEDEDPQRFADGSSEACFKKRSSEAYWYCWYEAYPDPIVPIDSIALEWWEASKCHSFLYVYTPLACCFADPDEDC